MKKSLLLILLASTLVSGSLPAFSQSTAKPAAASDNKFKSGAKKVGNGIMWGPRKVGAGLKKMGEGTKKMFHKN